jgi:hypothetical protein
VTRRAISQDTFLAVQRRAAATRDHLRAAERYESWAAEVHPDDEVSWGDLLVGAAEQWKLAGEDEHCLDACRRAVATGDLVEPDTRCYLIGALVACGHRDEADKLAGEIRRERPSDPYVHLFIGEAYEMHGDPQQAITWFTAGMLTAMRDEDAATWDALTLMRSRRRVRHAVGFPPDEYDELALTVQ